MLSCLWTGFPSLGEKCVVAPFQLQCLQTQYPASVLAHSIATMILAMHRRPRERRFDTTSSMDQSSHHRKWSRPKQGQEGPFKLDGKKITMPMFFRLRIVGGAQATHIICRYDSFSWLEYSLRKNAAFCFVCRLFGDRVTNRQGGNVDDTFRRTGYTNWKKALEKGKGFNQHASSQGHRDALTGYRSFCQQKSVDVQLSSHNQDVLSARARAIARNRTVVSRLFDVVRLLGKLSLPFRGHDETESSLNKGVFLELVHHLAENGDEVLKNHLDTAAKNATYLSPTVQNEMIGVVGKAIKESVIKRVQEATFYSLMMDETTDLSHQEQVSIMVRYVACSQEQVTIEERLLCLVATTETTGEALAGLLLGAIESSGLDLSLVVGQGYDGGSSMRSEHKGVQARIKEKNPRAMFIHCYAHSLNRVLVNSLNHKSIPEARDFFAALELLISFLDASPARHAYFKSVQESIGVREPVVPGKGMSDTRWSSRAMALERYASLPVLKAAIATVEHVIESTSDGRTRAVAIGILKSVKTTEFVVLLCAFKPVLSVVNLVSEYLQNPQLDLLSAMQRVNTLRKELARMRSSEQWEKSRKDAEALVNGLEISDGAEEKRKRKLSVRKDDNPGTHVILSTEDRLYTQGYLLALDKMTAELNRRFPSELEDFSFLQAAHLSAIDAEERISALARKYPQLDADAAVAQWRLFRHIVKGTETMKELFTLVPSDYKDLKNLYKIFLTLPVTTASVERGFSKLALVKSKLRTVMCQTRLESLIFAAVEKDILVNIDVDDLVAKFAAQGDRRLELG